MRLAPIAALLLVPSLAAADGCPHAFVPFRVGTTWLYRVGGAPAGHALTLRLRVEASYKERGAEVAEVSSQLLDASATGERVLADVKQEYRCDGNGLHMNQGVPDGVTGPGGERLDMEVIAQHGVTLPPADALAPGVAWTEQVSMRLKRPGGKEPVAIERSAKLQLADAGSLTVGAGTFDAIHVVSRETLTMPGGAPEVRKAELWYGRGAGMLRARTSDGTLELVKFTPGR